MSRRSDSLEAAGLPRPDAEHAPDLAEGEDRRVHHLGEDGVRRPPAAAARWSRSLVSAPASRSRSPSPIVPRTGIVRPTSVSGRPSTAAAHELVAAGHERPAVGGVAVHERADLLHEALDHGVEAEIARQRLARLEQRPLLGDAPVALAQEAARVDRDRGLARDRLGERDLAGGPGVPPRRGAAPSTPISRSNATIGVASEACSPRSLSSLRSSSAGSSSSGASSTSPITIVRRSRAARLLTGSRLASPSGGAPSASHSATTGIGPPGSPSRMKQRDHADALGDLGHGDAQELVEVALRAQLEREARDQPLALERLLAARPPSARARAPDRPRPRSDCISASSSSAKTRGVRDRCEDDPDDLARAATTGTNAQLFTRAISFSRLFTIGEASASKTAKAAASRTAVLIPDVSRSRSITWPHERLVVAPAVARDDDPGLRPGSPSTRHRFATSSSKRSGELVEQGARDAIGVTRVQERRARPADRRRARGRAATSAASASRVAARAGDEHALVPPAREQDERRDRSEQDRGEREPQVAPERLPLDQRPRRRRSPAATAAAGKTSAIASRARRLPLVPPTSAGASVRPTAR